MRVSADDCFLSTFCPATLGLAWKCRKIFAEFNESGPILFVTVLVGISAVMVFSIKFFAALAPEPPLACARTSSCRCILAVRGPTRLT